MCRINDCVHKLYLPRKGSGKGLLSVEDTILVEKKNHSEYAPNCGKKLLGEVQKEDLVSGDLTNNEIHQKRRENSIVCF